MASRDGSVVRNGGSSSGSSVNGSRLGAAYPEEVLRRAADLGIREQNYFWIAEQSLQKPLRLPKNWFEGKSGEGHTYFFNDQTGQSIWTHPALEQYRQIYRKNREAGTNMSSNQSIASQASYGYNATSSVTSVNAQQQEKQQSRPPALQTSGGGHHDSSSQKRQQSPTSQVSASRPKTFEGTSLPNLVEDGDSGREGTSPAVQSAGGASAVANGLVDSSDYWYAQFEAASLEKKRLQLHNERMERLMQEAAAEQNASNDVRNRLHSLVEEQSQKLRKACRALRRSLAAKGYPASDLRAPHDGEEDEETKDGLGNSDTHRGVREKKRAGPPGPTISAAVDEALRILDVVIDPGTPDVDDRKYLKTWEGVSLRVAEEMKACFDGTRGEASSSSSSSELTPRGREDLRDRLEALTQIIATYGEYLPEDERKTYIFSMLRHISRSAKGSTMVPLEMIVQTMGESKSSQIEQVVSASMREKLAIEPPSNITALRSDLEEARKQLAKVTMQFEKKTHEYDLLFAKAAGTEARLEDSRNREESLLNRFAQLAHGMDELKDAHKLASQGIARESLPPGVTPTDVQHFLTKITNLSEELTLANKRATEAERRLEHMLKQESELKSDVVTLESTLSSKLERKRQQCLELAEKTYELEKVSNELYTELQNALALSGRLDNECIALKRELEVAKSSDKKTDRLNDQLADETARAKGLERTVGEMQSLLQEASRAAARDASRIVELEQQLESTRSNLKDRSEEVYRLRSRNERLATSNEELELESREMKRLQASLNDRIVELQGNIRVFARIRPRRVGDNCTPAQFSELAKFPDYNLLEFNSTPYEFDRVFTPEASQQEVFDETLPAVRAVLNGGRLCVFAYGQTGSGKTFTMEGSSERDDSKGVNTRCLELIFAQVSSDVDVHSVVKFSLLEVYNDKILDLLSSRTGSTSSEGGQEGLEVRVGKAGAYVENLTEMVVSNVREVDALLAQGSTNRKVASNNINEYSSRSHAVILVKVDREDRLSGKATSGRLCLCDLAGSERVKSTAVTGQRLREAQYINKSLSALGDVIAALAQKDKHIPFRNSKLTFLLQDYLREHSKVIMIVNISPVPDFANESICSLNFAARCRSVQLGLSRLSVAFASGNGGK